MTKKYGVKSIIFLIILWGGTFVFLEAADRFYHFLRSSGSTDKQQLYMFGGLQG